MLQAYKELCYLVVWWDDFQVQFSKIIWSRGSQGQWDTGVTDGEPREKGSLRPGLYSIASTFQAGFKMCLMMS